MEECIRDALGPFLGLLSPEEIADHRRFLTAFITTHPAAVPLYERLRKRPNTNTRSGDMAREGAPDEDENEVRSDGTSGERGWRR